jgi:hypothetical protein
MFRLSLLLLILMLSAAGCGEDTTTPGTASFRLNLAVTDPMGDPVAGLEAKLDVSIPGVGLDAAKASTALAFDVAHESDVSLVIYDLEGKVVRNLVDDTLPAGRHIVMICCDDQGQPLQGTHVYRCEMVATEAGLERFRESIYMTLYTSLDHDQQPLLGVTDLGGRISFTDKTEFPFLYELGPQPLLDENSTIMGTFDFSELVTIALVDPATNLRLETEVVITDGPNRINLVWDEDLASKVSANPAPPHHGTLAATKAGPIPPPEYSLGPNYPNPFN